MMYYYLLLLLGLLPLLGALLFAKWNLQNPEKCRRLPRERVCGAVIGVICLVWSAWHGCQMLEGGLEKFQTIIWLLVPTGAVACWFWLDYLLARSLGGLLIGAFPCGKYQKPLQTYQAYNNKAPNHSKSLRMNCQ